MYAHFSACAYRCMPIMIACFSCMISRSSVGCFRDGFHSPDAETNTKTNIMLWL